MSLQKTDVERIAYLARLAIAETDIPRYAQELSSILDLVRQMEVVDTSGVIPMAHPQDTCQRLRPDVVAEDDQSALFQSIAPLTESGLYLVPKVIE